MILIKTKQRIKTKSPNYKDSNLIIEKALEGNNTIEVDYRLSNEVLTIVKLMNEYSGLSSRIDFGLTIDPFKG